MGRQAFGFQQQTSVSAYVFHMFAVGVRRASLCDSYAWRRFPISNAYVAIRSWVPD